MLTAPYLTVDVSRSRSDSTLFGGRGSAIGPNRAIAEGWGELLARAARIDGTA